MNYLAVTGGRDEKAVEANGHGGDNKEVKGASATVPLRGVSGQMKMRPQHRINGCVTKGLGADADLKAAWGT